MVFMLNWKKLISLGEAISIIRSNAPKITDIECLNIRKAIDRVLVYNIRATHDIPPFDRAAMDGYAVRAEDIWGANNENPRILKLIGESDIGKPFSGSLGVGEAVYVHTGSMIPSGADAVVPVEYTRLEGSSVYVYRGVVKGANISKRGEDVKKGQIVLKRGKILDPCDIAILKAMGIREVRVYRRPKISVLACGSELVDNPDESGEGKIIEYSREIVIGLARKYGCDVIDLGIVPDDMDEIHAKILEQKDLSDIIITVGGTSIGKHDLIPLLLKTRGELLFHGVSIQPGKPVCAGKIDGLFLVGAPGLPVATYVVGITIIKAAIEETLNISGKFFIPTIRARLTRKIWSKPGVRSFVRVKIYRKNNEYYAEPIMISGAGILSSLVMSDGIVEIPEEIEGYDKDQVVEVQLIKYYIQDNTD